jgi:hypothetical protein
MCLHYLHIIDIFCCFFKFQTDCDTKEFQNEFKVSTNFCVGNLHRDLFDPHCEDIFGAEQQRESRWCSWLTLVLIKKTVKNINNNLMTKICSLISYQLHYDDHENRNENADEVFFVLKISCNQQGQ